MRPISRAVSHFTRLAIALAMSVPVVLMTTSTPATAATCGAWRTTSGGVDGAYAWCNSGRRYLVSIECRDIRLGFHYGTYYEWGPIRTSGSSTAWCRDGNDTVSAYDIRYV